MVGAIVVGVTLPPSLEEDGVEVEVVDVEDPDEEDERPDVVVVTDRGTCGPARCSGELVVAAPGWSRETTMPMATVAPVAAMTAPRVSQRSRDVAFSRSRDPCARVTRRTLNWGAFLCGRPNPTIVNSQLPQHSLWAC